MPEAQEVEIQRPAIASDDFSDVFEGTDPITVLFHEQEVSEEVDLSFLNVIDDYVYHRENTSYSHQSVQEMEIELVLSPWKKIRLFCHRILGLRVESIFN